MNPPFLTKYMGHTSHTILLKMNFTHRSMLI